MTYEGSKIERKLFVSGSLKIMMSAKKDKDYVGLCGGLVIRSDNRVLIKIKEKQLVVDIT